MMPAGVAPAGRDRGASQLGQVAVVHSELADGADLAFIDVQEPSIGLSRASTAPTAPEVPIVVLPCSVSVPPGAIE